MPDRPLDTALERLIVSGTACKVLAYVTPRGEAEALEGIKSAPKEVQARFVWLCKLLAEKGPAALGASWKHERHGKIDCFAMRLQDQFRVAFFRDEGAWICTHTFQKNGRWRAEDFTAFENRRTSYVARRAKLKVNSSPEAGQAHGKDSEATRRHSR